MWAELRYSKAEIGNLRAGGKSKGQKDKQCSSTEEGRLLRSFQPLCLRAQQCGVVPPFAPPYARRVYVNENSSWLRTAEPRVVARAVFPSRANHRPAPQE